MTANMPAAEVEVTTDLVRALLANQFPHLAHLPVEVLANGWDNILFCVGDDLVARLPRRRVAVPLIEAEQRWLPELAAGLPLPIPAPIHSGTPGAGYPWPWSICPLLPGGSVLALVDGGGRLADPAAEAGRLATFHVALHRPAPDDAPPNPVRGIPLVEREEAFLVRLDQLGAQVDRPAVERCWADATEAVPWGGPPLWLHGDPHPGNLLTDGTRITGVIDFGDITAGDPATDLAAAWLVFDADARATYRRRVEADDATWRRARGWALNMAVAMLTNSADNPPYQRLGERTLRRILGER